VAAIGFHALLVTSGAWAADLVTAGVAPAAAAVYDARQAQGTTRADREVWLEALNGEALGRGFQGFQSYPYLVHVRVASPGNVGPARSDAAKLRTLIGHLDTIRERYHGQRPFLSTVPEIAMASAVIETIDEDPEEARVLSGSIRVTFYATALNGVSAWSNKSAGPPSSLTQTVNARKPAVGVAAVNGLNTLVGTGSADDRYLSSTSIPVTGPPFFIWAVIRQDAITNGIPWGLSDFSSTAEFAHWSAEYNSSGRLRFTAEDNSFNAVTISPTTLNTSGTDALLLECEEIAVASRAAVSMGDDANEATDATSIDVEGTGLVDFFSAMGLVRNSGSSILSPLTGDLCELLVSKAIPTAQQKTDIRNYLADKWGITLL
jgi:hypothetical protein